MPGKSVQDHGISLSPLRPAVLTFTVDDAGLEFVQAMIEIMQKRYGMSYEQAVEELNSRLGASEGHPAAVIAESNSQGLWWFHDGVEDSVRKMFEGMYWRRGKLAQQRVAEWQAGQGQGKAVHEYLNWTPEQYAKWLEDGTLPPPSTSDCWEL